MSSASTGSSYQTRSRSSSARARRRFPSTSSFWLTSTMRRTPSPSAFRTASARRAVLPRIGVVDLELVVAAARGDVALRLLDHVLHPVRRPPAAPVGRDAVRDPAPEPIERLARRLADDVPQRDVERGERVRGHAETPDPSIGAIHALPEPLDQPRVLADEERRKARLEVHLDGLGAAPAEGEAVAEPGDALVRVNVRHHQPVLAELERHRLRGRDGEDRAVDADDLHGFQSGTIAGGARASRPPAACVSRREPRSLLSTARRVLTREDRRTMIRHAGADDARQDLDAARRRVRAAAAAPSSTSTATSFTRGPSTPSRCSARPAVASGGRTSPVAVADHYVADRRGRGVPRPRSEGRVAELERNAREWGLTLLGPGDPRQGIVHVIGPEQGLTLPGLTLVCGDSHTATHGAIGALAFGIGASEVEHVLATQTIWQRRPRVMRVWVDGRSGRVSARRTSPSTSSPPSARAGAPATRWSTPARRSARSRWKRA